jgi:hypothetical protein
MGDGQLSKDSWGKLLAKYPDLIRNAVYEMVYGTATGTGSYIPDTIRRPEYQSATIDSNGKDWSNGNPYLPKYTPTPTPDKKKKKIDIEGDQI